MSSRVTLRGAFSVASFFALVCAAFASCAPPDFTFKETPEVDGGMDASVEDSGGGDQDTGVGGDGPVDPDGGVVPHCENRDTDADESDVDCGGADCEPCPVGSICNDGSDCVNGECTAERCQDATCTDEVRNNGESDEDCGGDDCVPCGTGKRCLEDDDCESLVCTDRECQAPSCDDKVLNGNEVDVDCSGSCEDLCDVGQGCIIDADCAMPPDPENETITCDDDVCVLHCGPGKADCDQAAFNGCEVLVNDDLEHCGSCETPCDPDHATGQCSGGKCEVATCDEGFANCDGEHENGCEVNLNSDPDHCGTCSTDCSELNGVDGCSGGVCTIDCNVGFDDCDDDITNGCETNTDTHTLHCGGCSNGNGQHAPGLDCPNGSGSQSPNCVAGVCGLTNCPTPGTGDCDGNGTCLDDLTTIDNCGGCGAACLSAAEGHYTPVCVDVDPTAAVVYGCRIGNCVQNATNKWEDCNNSPTDGCEKDLYNDVKHCGSCATDCTTKVGTQNVTGVKCTINGCAVDTCAPGFADCDGLFSTGCEVQKSNSAQNCGGCSTGGGGGVDCTTAFAHAGGSCVAGVCSMGACIGDWGNCNGSALDGCEEDLDFSELHCGACAKPCSLNSVTSENLCINGVCGPPVCTGAGQNCDANNANGCEDRNTDEAHCGTCNTVCFTGTGTTANTCTTGACNPTCALPATQWQNCDGNGTNGCENKLTNNSHCGTCGTVCTTGTGTTANNCSNGVCNPTCSTPSTTWENCDGNGANGCENKLTNSSHCGACGVVCQTGTSTTTNVCTAGVCNPTCASPSSTYENCDGNNANGCENKLTNASHCGACGAACFVGTGTTANTCSGGVCSPTCASPASQWQNCDGNNANGCENKLTNNSHCGACNNACTTGTGTTANTCTSGSCVPTCALPATQWENCDGNGANGCENKLTNSSHCGSCGTVCQTNTGTTANTCSGGSCSPTCALPATTYENCDGNNANGCENKLTNASHCGGCGNVCFVGTGTTANTCSGGSCSPTCATPSTTWENCDGNGQNGCENKLTNANHCGSCGNVCQTNANTTANTCSSGACNPTCQSPSSTYQNCDGNAANGCENKLTNNSHCGTCGTACQTNANTAANVCSNGTCAPTCQSPSSTYENCDGNPANGCENKLTNNSHCGTCGNACQTNANTASNNCSGGSCNPVCQTPSSTYQNCDGNAANGCENKLTNANHCGSCGNVCQTNANTTANTCSNGSCNPTCQTPSTTYQNCDGNAANGCENKLTNANHCGSCGNKCGGDGANVQSATCNGSGACSVTCTAASNMCPDTSDPERACTAPLGTTQNCSFCGEVCSGATPICSPSGCVPDYAVTVVTPDPPNDRGISSSQTFTYTHTLANGVGTYRAVVVGVSMHGNAGTTVTAKYNTVAMTSAINTTNAFGGFTRTAIFYILDASLPGAAGSYQVELSRSDSYGSFVSSALELLNVDQTTPVQASPVSTLFDSGCGPSTVTHNVPVTGTDQLIFTQLSTIENNGATGTPSNQTELYEAFQSPQITGISGYKLASSAQTVGWTAVTPCWGKVMVSAVFRSR